ncbi:uncharacterized protein LOC135479657 [Liolophura sinensis]|uniref:uncharacterized protein LOC135479657 n=1 Tax=Liolophura sinensis TaxID=3198878 RepID=UPI00315941C0
MFHRLFFTLVSVGLATCFFLIVAVQISTARLTDARNRLPLENVHRATQRETLQVTKDKKHPWKQTTHLGMTNDVILEMTKSIQDDVSSVLARERRDVPKQKRKNGKRKHRRRRKKKSRGRRNVNATNTRVRGFHWVPNTVRIPHGSCQQMWDATVCGNKTLITTTSNYVLRFWTRPKTKIPDRFAFEENETSILPSGETWVFQTGLYQLYAQILFLDDWFRTAVSIDVNGNSTFKCINDVGAHVPGRRHGHFYNTCAINAVVYLKRKDKLGVKILYDQSIIDLHADSTYFGMVLLSS